MVPGAKDVLLVALLIYTVLRQPKIHRCYGPLFRDPLAWWILAWPAWFAISLAWSPAPVFGAEELRAWRMLLVPLLLWPVMQQYRLLIITFVVGCGVVVLVQLGQVIGVPGFELDIQGRADAWMHPILAGAMLVTAAIWMLAGVLQWRERRAVAMAACLIVVVVGLALTGSRGPWVSLAVAGTMLVIGTLVLCPTARRRTVTMGALGLVAIGGLILLDVYVLSGRLTGPVRSRIETAMVETDSSAGDDHYEIELGGWHRTPVGYRLLIWEATRNVFLEHPITGIGGGGLSTELDEAWWLSDPNAAAAGIPLREQHLNPHSLYLQVLASTGLIGCLLLVIPMILAASRLLGRAGDPVFFGTTFVLVAWAAGAAFDAYQMMTAQVAVLMLVYAAAMITRPVRRELAT